MPCEQGERNDVMSDVHKKKSLHELVTTESKECLLHPVLHNEIQVAPSSRALDEHLKDLGWNEAIPHARNAWHIMHEHDTFYRELCPYFGGSTLYGISYVVGDPDCPDWLDTPLPGVRRGTRYQIAQEVHVRETPFFFGDFGGISLHREKQRQWLSSRIGGSVDNLFGSNIYESGEYYDSITIETGGIQIKLNPYNVTNDVVMPSTVTFEANGARVRVANVCKNDKHGIPVLWRVATFDLTRSPGDQIIAAFKVSLGTKELDRIESKKQGYMQFQRWGTDSRRAYPYTFTLRYDCSGNGWISHHQYGTPYMIQMGCPGHFDRRFRDYVARDALGASIEIPAVVHTFLVEVAQIFGVKSEGFKPKKFDEILGVDFLLNPPDRLIDLLKQI